MSKAVKKVAKIALPIAAPFLLGPAGLKLTGAALTAGSALAGAAGGALGGGGIKGALLGGLGGGISGGGLTGTALGRTLGSAGTSALGGALSGASSGGVKGALLGAAGGLASNYLSGPSLTADKLNAAPASSVAPSVANQAASKIASVSGSGAGGFSSFLKPAASLFGAYNEMQTNDELEDIIRKQQTLNAQSVAPYSESGLQANEQLSERLQSGFTAPDLANDAGYQFQLAEADKALGRAQSARGNFFSGEAIRELQDRSQGLADTTYNDAYNRYLAMNNQLAGQSGQGLQSATINSGFGDQSALASVLSNRGKSNALNRALASLLEQDRFNG